MSRINEEIYECDFCNAKIEWESLDERRGTIWYCEKCGKDVCSKCIEKKLGRSIVPSDDILCPDCIK